MTKTFTQDELIRFFYKETSKIETKEIEKALVIESQLAEEYKKLVSVINRLDQVEETPSTSSIQNIFNYSKSINLHSLKG